MLIAERARSGGGGSKGGGSSASKQSKSLLGDSELSKLEEEHAEGLTAAQIVDVFSSRGIRFSEATFRKYVQQGLLPRSRRVGRKGKNRGSLGLYPARAVRRINAVKKLMSDGYTIEQIQEQFLRFTDVIETLEAGLTELFKRFDAEAEAPRFDTKSRRSLAKELAEARKTADELMKRIGALSQRVSTARDDSYRDSGAAGSAEELL
jgi:DNA-binding transcriptional MerR regulator